MSRRLSQRVPAVMTVFFVTFLIGTVNLRVTVSKIALIQRPTLNADPKYSFKLTREVIRFIPEGSYYKNTLLFISYLSCNIQLNPSRQPRIILSVLL